MLGKTYKLISFFKGQVKCCCYSRSFKQSARESAFPYEDQIRKFGWRLRSTKGFVARGLYIYIWQKLEQILQTGKRLFFLLRSNERLALATWNVVIFLSVILLELIIVTQHFSARHIVGSALPAWFFIIYIRKGLNLKSYLSLFLMDVWNPSYSIFNSQRLTLTLQRIKYLSVVEKDGHGHADTYRRRPKDGLLWKRRTVGKTRAMTGFALKYHFTL